MLSAEEHPGIFTFLVGMMVLVLTGVGLSLLIDQRLKFSAEGVKTQREVKQDSTELEYLIAWHDERSRLLNQSRLQLKTESVTEGSMVEGLKVIDQRKLVLKKTALRLREAIASLDGDFSFYRADYRRKAWSAAVGESLGNLKVRNGREYVKATILRVTDVGLEIRHEDGIARIQAPDLDSKWQGRFHWKDDERRKVLAAERENLEGETPGATADDD